MQNKLELCTKTLGCMTTPMWSYRINTRIYGQLPFVVHHVKVEKIHFQVKKCPKNECFWPIGKKSLSIDPQKGVPPWEDHKTLPLTPKKWKLIKNWQCYALKTSVGHFRWIWPYVEAFFLNGKKCVVWNSRNVHKMPYTSSIYCYHWEELKALRTLHWIQTFFIVAY